MKVISWNLGYWQFSDKHHQAWDYLRSELKPDLALLQEVVTPQLDDDEQFLFKPIHGGWGTALYSRGLPLEALPFQTHPTRVVAAQIALEDRRHIVVASIHAPIINQEVFPYLDRIFDAIEQLVGDNTFIVGGDLNSARLAEQVWPKHGHGPFFERLADSIFFDCVRKFYDEEPQTIFRPRQKHALLRYM